jgi:hypothetical protein
MTNMHGIMLKFKNKQIADQSRSLIDNNNMENKQQPIAEATKFDDWMRKINNTYYSNHAAMTAAYQKIKNEKV